MGDYYHLICLFIPCEFQLYENTCLTKIQYSHNKEIFKKNIQKLSVFFSIDTGVYHKDRKGGATIKIQLNHYLR